MKQINNALIIIIISYMLISCQKQQEDNMHHKYFVSMVGNSITAGAEDWNLMFDFGDKVNFINCGISGNKTYDVLNRIEDIISTKPDIMFIMIGINDLNIPAKPTDIVNNIKVIVEKIKLKLPNIKIYLQSVLPINTVDFDEKNRIIIEHIIELNLLIYQYAIENKLKFVDLNLFFSDKYGRLNKTYSYDGIHLNEAGYKLWSNILKPLITNELININK